MPEAMALPENEAIDQLKEELAKGTDINTLDQWGGTALIMACMEDKPAIATFLLDQGADITVADNSDKRNALHYAADNSMTDVVQRLLDGGLDVNAGDIRGLTPIIMNTISARDKFNITNATSSEGSDHPNVKAINDKNANVLKTAQLLVDNNADLVAGPNGQGPLFTASESNNVALVQILIDAGADVNAKDKSGLAPLHYSARRKARGSIKTLLAAGATVDLQDDYGFTPLHEAILSNDPEAVTMLLEAGADPTLKLTKGFKPYTNNETAFDIANDKGFAEIVQILETASA